MVDGVVEAAAKLLQQLRLADVLDVLVMSVLIYAAISWLRGAQSRFVVRGIGGLVALYFVARLLGMQLTLFVFQAVLTVAVVALVIIFQEDIRRGFERIAVRARLGARKAGAPEETTVRTVVRAVARLAAERTGALIVFKGREPLERHLSGGVLLHGRLSDQLLYSIFDTSSPGHDGAVVIDAGLVERFGVHLPLSTDPDGQGRGTRHAAALGLAERSDAFVIVVSEERGRISVAHAGSLRELSPTQVQEQLRDFVRQTTAGGLRARSGSLRRFGLKVLSVALAVVAWVVITRVQAETLERTLTVPVTYRNVPDAWMLEEPDPPSVRVTLTGTAQGFRVLDATRLTATLDVGQVHEGKQQVAIDDGALEVPRNVQVQRLEPRTATVVAYRTAEIELPVKPQIAGRVPRGMTLEALRATPDKVSVIVRAADRQRYHALKTEAVNLSELDRTTTVTRRVVLPEGVNTRQGLSLSVEVTAVLTPVARPRPAPSAAPEQP